MKFFLSSLANLFKGDKMRHNNAASSLVQGPGLSREDFMRIYESMPESARAQLFSGLDFKQKSRLLELLTPAAKQTQQPEVAAEPEWHAEDFLPDKDERKIARLRHVREVKQVRELFAKLAEYPARSLADVLEAESASVAAVVLLQLSHKQASRVLSLLSDLRRGEIVRAMAAERQISSEALVALGKKISERLQNLPQAEEPRLDGVKHVNEILKLLGAEDADRITREVGVTDAVLGKTLESSRFTFEDLTQLSAKDFRHLFSSMPDEHLWARALKAIDQGQRKAMLSKLPVKRAGVIAGAMAELKTTRLDSIDKARRQILGRALQLAARHEIRFAGNGLH